MQGRKRDNVDIGVNLRVKEVRLTLELPQAEFCKALQVSGGHYAEIELGHRRVNDRLVSLICAIYGVRETFLTLGEYPIFNEAASAKLEEVCRIFRELPPAFQDYLLQQTKNVKKLAGRVK
jgi:transcriptional regulator with XRE-family HTH domain